MFLEHAHAFVERFDVLTQFIAYRQSFAANHTQLFKHQVFCVGHLCLHLGAINRMASDFSNQTITNNCEIYRSRFHLDANKTIIAAAGSLFPRAPTMPDAPAREGIWHFSFHSLVANAVAVYCPALFTNDFALGFRQTRPLANHPPRHYDLRVSVRPIPHTHYSPARTTQHPLVVARRNELPIPCG